MPTPDTTPDTPIEAAVTPENSTAVDAADELVLIDLEIKQLFALQESALKRFMKSAGTDTIVLSRNGSRVLVKDELPRGQIKAFKTTCFSRYSVVVQHAPK